MITDQQMTGVPSASATPTRVRVQLTKPVQTANSGRVTQASRPTQPSTTKLYNPIEAKASAPSTTTAQPRQAITDSMSTTLGARTVAPQSNLDRAAAIISEMDDDEAYELLTGMANGTIKTKGPKATTPATATIY